MLPSDGMTKRSKLSMELSYASDSSDPDSDQEDSRAFGDLADDDDGDNHHHNGAGFHGRNRRKRRKTGKEAKDRAALGVFGSDSSEDEGGWSRSKTGSRGGNRSLRYGGVAFVTKTGTPGDEGSDSDGGKKERSKNDNEQEEDEDEDEDDEEADGDERMGFGLGSGGAAGRAGFGLGFNLGPKQTTTMTTPLDTDEMDIDQDGDAEGEYAPRLGLGSSTSTKRGFLFAPRATGGGAGSATSGASTPRSLNTHTGLGFQSASDSSGNASPRLDDSSKENGGRSGFGLGFKAAGTIDSTQLDAAPLPTAPATDGSGGPLLSNPLGKGFVSSAQRMAMFNPTEDFGELVEEKVVVRPSFTQDELDDRKGKRKGNQAGSANVNTQSFAARMMAKMGYVEGRGLGKTGEGILNPIEVKLRPQGAGVGVIKEKTEQAKQEERRAKELKGETVSDSDSEKERKRRKKRREAARRGGSETPGSGATTPGGTSKRKTKFRTAEEISQDAKGLEVPSVLMSIIDLTGKEAKKIDPGTPGLLSVGEQPKEEDPNVKIARMARRDLEGFAAEWKTLQVRKKFVDVEEKAMNNDLDEQVEACQRLQNVVEFIKSLQKMSMSVPHTDLNEHESKVNDLTEKLENMQIMYKEEVNKYGLSEAAVAAFHPLIKSAFVNWDPLHDPVFLLEPIRKLRHLFKIRTREDVEGIIANNADGDKLGKSSSHYESMIYNIWLPKIRSAINNHWSVHDPVPVVTLLEAWETVLPPFIQANIIEQLIVPKLKAAVSSWNPRSANKKSAPPPLHVWVFPWLPYLGDHSDDLIRDVKRKFRVILDQWDLSRGVVKGIEKWQEVFGPGELEKLLVHHLLPRLADLLRREFSVNPANQQLESLDNVLQWHSFFRLSTFTQLLEAEFFPKWLQTLYSWLTSGDEPNYDEVSEWYQWWSGNVFPETLKDAPQVRREFRKGLDMIQQALDLEPGDVLAPPSAGPVKPIRPSSPPRAAGKSKPPHSKASGAANAGGSADGEFNSTFREYVDEWCTEHNLLLIPQRKAHEATGQPLFRITESASGTGGVLCYFHQDVIWAQDRKKKDIFEPVGLDKIEKRLEQGHRS